VVQKTLEVQIIDLIRFNNSISKIEIAKKTGKSKAKWWALGNSVA